SARRLDEPGDLAGLRHAAGLAPGEDDAAVDRHRELAEAAPADFRRNVQRRLQLVAETHRLPSQVHSDCAALDVDLHPPSFNHTSSSKARMLDDLSSALYTARHEGIVTWTPED